MRKVIQNVVSKCASSALMVYTAMSYLPVYAKDPGAGGVGDENPDGGGLSWVEKLSVAGSTDATDTVEYILGILITVCKLFGGAILLWGIVCWVMAMKNEDAGSKQKALMATLTGVILFTIKSILQGAGVIV